MNGNVKRLAVANVPNIFQMLLVSLVTLTDFYTVSQKNDDDVLHYNFNAHQPILIIFGRDIAE